MNPSKFFSFKERGTNLRNEIYGGVITFLAMSYILFVNTDMLSQAGMPAIGVFFATALATGLTTILMGFWANLPVALAPGMGLNAFFTFGVVMGLKYSYQEALVAVFISGIIFFIIAITGLRQIIINAIPEMLKHAVGIGIGFFIAFIGFKNAHIIVADEATFVKLGDLATPYTAIAVVGILLTLVLMIRKVNASIFIGIVVVIILDLIFGVTKFEPGVSSFNKDTLAAVGSCLNPETILSCIKRPDFYGVIVAMLFVDFFDTAGTLLAITGRMKSSLSKEAIENGIKRAMIVDATGTIFGSIIGTSTVTSYVESLTGVESGSRSGFSSVVAGTLFIVSLVFAPFLSLVSGNATAAALIIVGALMMQSMVEIDFKNFIEVVSTFIIIVVMMLTFSISKGISFGFIVYTVLMVATGQYKKVHPILYGLSIFFVIFFAFGLKV